MKEFAVFYFVNFDCVLSVFVFFSTDGLMQVSCCVASCFEFLIMSMKSKGRIQVGLWERGGAFG